MSTESKYPRVSKFPGTTDYYQSVNGSHKVVPADAIVIPRADLPVVIEVGQGGSVEVGQHGLYTRPRDVEADVTTAYIYLALAEYGKAHPPQDAAQVEALARLLWEYAQNPSGPGDTFDETSDAERNRHRNRAARLVARGVRVDLP